MWVEKYKNIQYKDIAAVQDRHSPAFWCGICFSLNSPDILPRKAWPWAAVYYMTIEEHDNRRYLTMEDQRSVDSIVWLKIESRKSEIRFPAFSLFYTNCVSFRKECEALFEVLRRGRFKRINFRFGILESKCFLILSVLYY